MGKDTGIAWTNATFNPWHGCTNVSPGCDHCYAEASSKRYGDDVWGKHAGRRLLSDKYWAAPLKWSARRVFCGSMCDVFESHPAVRDERQRLWALIEATPQLTWQLLTKRPENVTRMVPPPWLHRWPNHVWLGTTVEDQQRANIRIPRLLDVPGVAVRFLSCEPLLGPVDIGLAPDHRGHASDTAWSGWGSMCLDCSDENGDEVGWTYPAEPRIHWVIAGGESGANSRPMHPAWVRSLRDQCAAGQVPFFMKQWGAHTAPLGQPMEATVIGSGRYMTNDGVMWPLDARGIGTRDPALMYRTKRGHEHDDAVLDGRLHQAFPKAAAR